MPARTDLGDRIAERGPVHDEDRERRPQKRREHAEDGVGAVKKCLGKFARCIPYLRQN